jgi:hypothetical protein
LIFVLAALMMPTHFLFPRSQRRPNPEKGRGIAEQTWNQLQGLTVQTLSMTNQRNQESREERPTGNVVPGYCTVIRIDPSQSTSMEVLIKPENAIVLDVQSWIESTLPGSKPPYKLQLLQSDQPYEWQNGRILPTVTISVMPVDDRNQKIAEAANRYAPSPRDVLRLLGTALSWTRIFAVGLLGMSSVFAKRLWVALAGGRISVHGRSFWTMRPWFSQSSWQRRTRNGEYVKCAKGCCEAYLR